MTLLITVTLSGTLVIDPQRSDDMELLRLLSAKRLLRQESEYAPGQGYVGVCYEPSTLTLGTLAEYPEVKANGYGMDSYHAWRRAEKEQEAAD